MLSRLNGKITEASKGVIVSMAVTRTLSASLALVLLVACPPAPDPDPRDAELRALLAAAGVTPITKPATDPAKVALGQALFFDKILSGNRDISCATCHHPEHATTDNISLTIGHGGAGLGPDRDVPTDEFGDPIFQPRNSQALFNLADFPAMFFDGRVESDGAGGFDTPADGDLLPGLESPLAAQALFPITDRGEMRGFGDDNELAEVADGDFHGIWQGILDRVLTIPGYQQLFAQAYYGVPQNQLTMAHAANAIAEFQIDAFTLTDSPFDAYLAGDDGALTAQEKDGLELFFDQAGCFLCHSGPHLTDFLFHDIGVPQLGPGKGDGGDGRADYGRERVTGLIGNRYEFRTPPLRNVAATGPWGHDGAFTSLRTFVELYNDPEDVATNYDASQLEPLLQNSVVASETPLILERLSGELPDINLNAEQVDAIVAFLNSLTSPSLATLAQTTVPTSVPSGLPVAD